MEIWPNIRKSQYIMTMVACKIFFWLSMCLLRAPIDKNSHILAGIYFIFLNKRPRSNLKDFQDQICAYVKKSEK